MEVVGLSSSFQSTGTIDQFESLIWTDRYNTPGEFELYTPVRSDVLTTLALDNFVYLRDSEHIMIVESRNITTDSEKGNHLIIKGRSLESILDRRMVLYDTALTGNFQTAIQGLLNGTFISPGGDRTVPNFVFLASTDPAITAMTINSQYSVTSVLDIVQKECQTRGLGFKITLNITNQMVFSLYRGTDRTYAQTTRDPVVFSPKLDNLVNSDYKESKVQYKNVAYIIGEGTGNSRTYSSTGVGVGLARREVPLDGSSISANISPALSQAQYSVLLAQYGGNYLAGLQNTVKFEGSINPTLTARYGTHFFMGDTVQVENEYGMLGSSRVTEMIYTQDPSKTSAIPTFLAL